MIHWLVVTPTLGNAATIEKTAETLSHLEGHVTHVVVCPSAAFVNMSDRLSNALIITESADARGMYNAINLGIAAAPPGWDFLLYVNDDDYLLPACKGLAKRIRDTENHIFYGKTKIVDVNDTFLFTAPYAPLGEFVPDLISAGIIPFMQVSMIIPRGVFNRLGLFDSSYRYAGDLEFIVRAINVDIKFSFLNIFVGAFRMHRGQLSGNRTKMDAEHTRIMSELLPHGAYSYPACIKRIILKLGFRLWNFKSYVQRFLRMRTFTSVEAFNKV